MNATTVVPHRRRRFLRYAGGLGAALALARPATSWAQAPAGGPLTVGLLRAPTSAIVDICEKRGWFKEAGVEINSVLFAAAAGPKIVQALGGGSVGLSFVNTTAMLLGMAGGAIPLRAISIPTDPSRLFAVISTPANDSIPKLAGKRVATTGGTGLHYYLARVLAKYGMTFKDIEFVNLPAADGQAAFVAGRVDAIVPSVNGRFYIMGAHKEAREIFTYEDFTRGPGSKEPFLNYDLFVTTESVLQARSSALRAFLAAYHNRGVAFVMNPATRAEAIRVITEYVNVEQKNPTDAAIIARFVDGSGFFDTKTVKQLMTRDDFLANLEYQVKFFMDLGQIKTSPDLRKAIVTDLL